MLVSFVMPAFKRRFLKEAIASILAQTFRDFELVVVDDASPEDLKSVVDQFSDSRLSYYRNTENLGGRNLVAAWEHALGYAKGEWCILAGDDDVYLPECLASLVALSGEHPSCDLVHARSVMVDEDGRWQKVSDERLSFETQIQFAYARAARHCDQQAPDFMFRLSAFRAEGGFVRFPLAWFSDDATWMRLAKNGCAHTSQVQFCFRMSGLNITTTFGAKVADKIRAGEEYRSWLRLFSASLMPQTKEEHVLLNSLLADADATLDNIARYEMRMIPLLSTWYRVLRLISVTKSLRQMFVFDRIKKCFRA